MTRKFGEGELGEVWLSFDRELGTAVVLKLLRESIGDLHTGILKRETERNRDLDHPHLLKVHGFVYPDGMQPAISMEYAPSGSLADLISGDRPFLEVAEIEGWISECCEALTYLHEDCEIVHRGLKANNLLLDANGRIKLADYGLSARVAVELDEETQELTLDSDALHHASPQLLAFPYDSDPRHDLFALGVTIFHLLTGTFPFEDRGENRWPWDPENLLSMSGRREELGKKGEPIPPRWDHAVARCLAEAPEDRPASAREFAALLEEPEVEEAGEVEAAPETVILLPPMTTEEAPQNRERSFRAKIAWLAATFALLGLLTGVLLGLAEVWKDRAEATRGQNQPLPNPILSALSE